MRHYSSRLTNDEAGAMATLDFDPELATLTGFRVRVGPWTMGM